MQWLLKLEKNNIPFCIHVLQKNDSIIMYEIIQKRQIIYIVDGLIQVLKIFTNKEQVCLYLIYKNSIIPDINNYKNNNNNYYYKIIALKKTVIATITSNKSYATLQKNNKIFQEFQLTYNQKKRDLVSIFIYKNTTQRLIQLLLIMVKNFGIVKQKHIIIPFSLSHNTIGTIIGSQRITINRIMFHLKQKKIINYNKEKIIIYNIIQLIQY